MSFYFLHMKQFRESTIRWKGWDYSQNGIYFITINTQHRIQRFGSIKNKKMYLSVIGHAVLHFWNDIPNHFTNICVDAFVVMPDHIHGIIIIKKPPELIAHGTITPRRDPSNISQHRISQKNLFNIPLPLHLPHILPQQPI